MPQGGLHLLINFILLFLAGCFTVSPKPGFFGDAGYTAAAIFSRIRPPMIWAGAWPVAIDLVSR
jgi:hypothetical protein